MPHKVDIFFDIETDWHRRPTVVGFVSSETGTVQLVGEDITRLRLLRQLPKEGRIFTFNGHAFDLSVIRKQLRLDLRERFDSHDLMWICRRHGLRGGQKSIEQQLGFRRGTEGLDGLEAIRLWQEYQAGDDGALSTLLEYNRDDLEGMRFIKRHLGANGLLGPATEA